MKASGSSRHLSRREQKDKDKWEGYKEISRIAVSWCRGNPQKDSGDGRAMKAPGSSRHSFSRREQKDGGNGRAMKALPYQEPVDKPLEQKGKIATMCGIFTANLPSDVR